MPTEKNGVSHQLTPSEAMSISPPSTRPSLRSIVDQRPLTSHAPLPPWYTVLAIGTLPKVPLFLLYGRISPVSTHDAPIQYPSKLGLARSGLSTAVFVYSEASHKGPRRQESSAFQVCRLSADRTPVGTSKPVSTYSGAWLNSGSVRNRNPSLASEYR